MGAERIEEIIKKFDLPERQTKINTLLKLQSENDQVYCLCRSSDTDKFMICCEKCDEWYHGACIGLEENEAKVIKKWYCFECIEKYRLKIVYFSHDVKKSSKKNGENRPKTKISCRKRIHCNARLQNDQQKNCFTNGEYNKDCRPTPTKITEGQSQLEYESHNTDTVASKICKQTVKANEEKQTMKLHKNKLMPNKEYLEEMAHKLCHRPGCSKFPRSDAKYCSDVCGLNMAMFRLRSVITQLNTNHQKFPSELDILKLENILLQKKVAFENLQSLDTKEIKLKELIARSKLISIQEFDQEEDDDSNTSCVICDLEIPSCSYLNHMAICFGNFESQANIVNLNRSYSKFCYIFCDHYDLITKTFCNRLRFVCPNHLTPGKVNYNEVCGFPVTTDVGAERFCRKPKKTCNNHCSWENLAISEVDFERFQEWKKISQLSDEEKTIGNQESAIFRNFLQLININIPT